VSFIQLRVQVAIVTAGLAVDQIGKVSIAVKLIERHNDLPISRVSRCTKGPAFYSFPLDEWLKRSARRMPVGFRPCSRMVV
jgi:hypothetical protein